MTARSQALARARSASRAESGAASLQGLLAAAAAVVIALAVVLLARRLFPHSPPPPPPGPAAYVTLRTPRGELADPPREFSWVAVPGARQYRIRIADADAVWPMFVRTTSETSLLLDPKQAAALTPGRIHIWEVEALGENDLLIATGGTRFRITPPGGV